MKKVAVLVLITFLFLQCKKSENTSANNTQGSNENVTMYYGGDIITMEGDQPTYAEALVVKDGKIAFVGGKDEAMKQAGEDHSMVDLKGQTLVPGFVDGHAHFASFGSQAVTANLLANPDGKCDDIPTLIATLKEWHAVNGVDKTNGWIVGMGFDDAALKENRFPTKDDLDKVSKDIPVIAVHISGHFSVMNSKGLEKVGITKDTKDPSGGLIRRVAGSKEPNGVLEELASIPNMLKILTPETPELGDFYMDKGQELALSYGYTTANEGRAMVGNHKTFVDYANKGKFKLDVNSDVDYTVTKELMATEWNSKTYKNHYRIKGVKLTLDGSPQGRTAWRTIPYILPPDGQPKTYKGYPALPEDKEVERVVNEAYSNNWQLSIHCNADASMDQLCRALDKVERKLGSKERRTALIHGQLIRMNQIDSLKKYKIIGSFFPMHTFYWGDWYKKIIGSEKANQISPIKTALNKGVKVTSHTDAPVALPNLMMIMYTTVNRLSRSGSVMGESERLTPYEALKSLTIWGAYQFFEEDSKGSLKEGKLADLVVLDKNPLKVDPITLKDIKVMQTIKEGKTVYTRK
ncbi:Amidohydrolase [Flavobacterium sp. 9R]|uniref:amidohydrolase n=1 Tax=Flavobacterium sp. 9R TaxID=2653143 RepID=UPI0012F43626|nr:amidohydrolase [Flavobacterium sp. 9R]VXB16772.1 Amidohydrolase [Flavobacterium sp. 9R]